MPAHSEPETKYTYLVADLLTGTIRDEIPFSQVAFSRELNRPGGFHGSVSIEPHRYEHLTDMAVPNRVTEANITPGNTALWILRRGTPVWGGIIWSFDANLKDRTVSFAGQDFLSYYDRRVVVSTLEYASTEQFEIVEGLIAHAQDQTGGDIGTTVEYESASGVERDRTYPGFEHKKILEALSQLGDVQDGFDFAIDYSGSQSAGLEHQITLNYPYRGRDTGLVFDSRKNVRLLKWTKDGQRMVNRAIALGSGEGDDMVQSTQSDTALLASWPVLEDVYPFKDVVETPTIVAHAQQQLALNKRPIETLEIEILPDDADAALGSFIVGDLVRCIADEGFVSLDAKYRVMGYTVDANSNGLETVKVSLAALEATT